MASLFGLLGRHARQTGVQGIQEVFEFGVKRLSFFFSEDGNGRKDGVPLRALTLPVSIFSC
jgi:hypothetical protein